MALDLDTFLNSAIAADSFEALRAAFEGCVAELGVTAIIYSIDRYGFESVEEVSALEIYSFPQSWLDFYIEQALFECDPVLKRCQQALFPFHWFDLEQEGRVSDRERVYFDNLRSHGFVDGIALPVFGPTGIAAYFTMGSSVTPLTREPVILRTLQSVCHHMHLRNLELKGRAGLVSRLLSAREVEVLQWMARGKSNTVIADILEVSPHTVDTIIRRAYAKLGASNRISAVLKAAASGLISI